MSFLELENIRKSFGASTAVELFNLQAEQGEFVSFLGPSGCGKTTTLRMIAGFEHPTTGHIKVGGQNITHHPPNLRKIGMVFQSYALFPNMTVAENIGFGLKIAKHSSSDIKKRVDEMLELVSLTELAKRYPGQISGGQAQRVALARALAPKPRLLLLDEPLSALDALIRRSLREEIRRIQQQLGVTAIYVTHDQEEALSLSDRIVVMSKGKIEQIGTPFELYNFPASGFVASFIGTLNVLPIKILNNSQGLVELAGQQIYVTAPLSQSNGSTVNMALRPENITFAQGEQPDINVITATIKTISFLGAVIRVRLEVANTGLEMDIFNSRELVMPKVGDVVKVAFDKASGLILGGKIPLD
jgi:putative spermidine/putrescine transport system ATP-binding protein